jgi:methionyl aminopeptidase
MGVDLVAEFGKLLKARAIRGYPVLVEKNNRPVSQSEHTVFVSEESASVLTKQT